MRFMLFLALLLSWVSWVGCLQASADTLSAVGGISFGRNSGLNDLKSNGPILGVEYSFPLLSKIEFGGFYQYTALPGSNGMNDSVSFMGAMFRFEPGGPTAISPFFDVRLGVATRSETTQESNLEPAAGAGVGIRFPISKKVSISPRMDVNTLPDAATPSAPHELVMDAVVLLSLHL
jgi:hypothetical protein